VEVAELLLELREGHLAEANVDAFGGGFAQDEVYFVGAEVLVYGD
jgi:hypothetical protein